MNGCIVDATGEVAVGSGIIVDADAKRMLAHGDLLLCSSIVVLGTGPVTLRTAPLPAWHPHISSRIVHGDIGSRPIKGSWVGLQADKAG